MLWVIVGVAVAALVGIVTFALVAERNHRSLRRSLAPVRRQPAPDAAYRAVVNARSAFTRSVQAYEEALDAGGREGTVTTGAADLQLMEEQKDQRRARLMEAQRLWETVRPAASPESPVRFWIGVGELWGWSLLVAGFESAIIRLEHPLDRDCWVVVETRRLRLGPALGAERLRLGLVIDGAHIGQLTDLIQAAMGSAEVAVRPGLSIARSLGERRHDARPLLTGLRATLDRDRSVFTDGVPDGVRQQAIAHLTSGRGIELGQPDDGLGERADGIGLRIGSSGISLLAGMWTGRRPAARILAASNHQAWVRANLA